MSKIIQNILLVALVFVAYLLFDTWQREHPAPKAQMESIPIAQLSPEAPLNVMQTSKVQHTTSSNKSTSLVQVKTDVMQMQIDPKGGNIVNVKLLDYKEQLKDGNAFTLLSNDPKALYVAQSGLVSDAGPDSSSEQAVYTVEHKKYDLGNQPQIKVVFTWHNSQGIEVQKIFTFNRGSYEVGVDYVVSNTSSLSWRGQEYYQLERKEFKQSSGFFGFSTFVGGAISTDKEPFEKITFDDMAEQSLKEISNGGWLAMIQQYFISAWVPQDKEQTRYRFYTLKNNDDTYTLGTIGPVFEVLPSQTISTHSTLYTGPLLTENLKHVAKNLDLTIDYGIFWYISNALFYLLNAIQDVVGNWGVAIILLTLIVKIALYAPSAATYRSAIKMRALQPKIQAIKERTSDDKMAFHKAVSELYKTQKVNPLGGCLPLLLQIPIFIALYWVLVESVELRHAPFFAWIQDLSARDPYYILPVIMGVTQYIQQKMSPPPADPTQAKVMNMLPIVFTLLMLYLPAGLIIYMIVNNVFSIAQQWYITKKFALTHKHAD